MASVRLRPVNQQPTSPSSTTLSQSSSPRELADQSPGPSVMFAPPTTPSGGHRRPLSPGTLRDLDLSSNASLALRGYPPPPTGHDLMAMFPPSPPTFSEIRPSSSGIFSRQERAFFAQAGKEIVRVRVEVDYGRDAMTVDPTQRNKAGPSKPSGPQWPQAPYPTPGLRHSPHNTPPQKPAMRPPAGPGQPPPRQIQLAHSPSAPGRTPGTTPPFAQRTPPGGANSSQTPSPDDTYDPDDPDEAWRRPIPHAERRRAGKHTKRVLRT